MPLAAPSMAPRVVSSTPGLRAVPVGLDFDAPVWLWRASFVGTAAAPLPAALPIDVGGPLVVADTAGTLLSQAGGKLVCAGGQGSPVTGNPGVWAAGVDRAVGRTLLATLTFPTASGTIADLDWDINQATSPHSGVRFAAGTGAMTLAQSGAVAGVLGDTVAAATAYDFGIVLRAVGFFLLRRVGRSGAYSLLWPSISGSQTPLFGGVTTRDTAWSLDDFRGVDLPAPWTTDYGPATARLSATLAGDTLTATPDCIVEHTITAATGVTQELSVRRTTDNDRWVVRMSQTGSTVKLIEIVGGSETERASAAQTWTDATSYRVVVVAVGSAIKTFIADVAKTNYASATSNQTATGVKVDTAGANLVCWPRFFSLPWGL